MFFLYSPFFFDDPVDVGNLISCSSAFSKYMLNISKFTGHVLLKPGLENFEHYFASMWDDCYCAVVWAFFRIDFFGIGMKTNLFQSYGPAEFSKFAGILCATLSLHHLLEFKRAQLEFHHLHWLRSYWCFLKAHVTSHSRMSGSRLVITPSWLSGSLKSFFCIVFLCILSTSSSYLLLLLGPYHFCPLLCLSLHKIFPWYL